MEDWYEIKFRGEAGPATSAAFQELEVDLDDGVTVMSGRLADQAALHGVLERARRLGLDLLSVRRGSRGDAKSVTE